MLNTSPAAMFDHLLAEEPTVVRESWFSAVAPRELQRYYDAVRRSVDGGDLEVPLPTDVRDLGPEGKATVKAAMRSGAATEPTVSEARAYAELTEAVSLQAVGYVRSFRQSTFNADIAEFAACDDGAGALCTEDGARVTGRGSGQPIPAAMLGRAPAGVLNRTSTHSTSTGGTAQVTVAAPVVTPLPSVTV